MQDRHFSPRIKPLSSANRQRGVALLIAVIMLVILTLAGVALVRSVDTATLIGGNFASRQAAVQGADVGIEAALSAVVNTYAVAPDTAVANKYYPVMQALDSSGVPTGITWASANTTTAGGYTYQYVIERLCTGATPVTNPAANCVCDQPVGGGSNSVGDSIFVAPTAIYYRVTLRATDSRGTATFIQAVVAL